MIIRLPPLVLLGCWIGLNLTAAYGDTNTAAVLSISDLREGKEAVLNRQPARLQPAWAKLEAARSNDEATIIAFLRSDFVTAENAYQVEQLRKLYEFTPALLNSLKRIGGTASVQLCIEWLTRWSWKERALSPLLPAETIAVLSDRVTITREQLKPVLESGNPDLAALGQNLWQVISYTDITPDTERVLANGGHLKDNLQREAGLMEDWTAVAKEMGYDVSGPDKNSELYRLVSDFGTRLQRQERELRQARDSHSERRHRFARERLLRSFAVEELIHVDRNRAFDALVDWLEAEDDWSATVAAYYLFRLTGHQFAVWADLDYQNTRTNIQVSRKAATAWRNWRKQLGTNALPKAEEAVASTEQRLVDARLDRHTKRGPEYTRDANAVIEEMISSTDRRILTMLVGVLATKTLTDAQVGRLIEAAKADSSQTHRRFLVQALATSGSTLGEQYVHSLINKESSESVVLDFLETAPVADTDDIAFLCDLYSSHPSARVQDAVVERAIARNYDRREELTLQDKLITSLAVIATNNQHKLTLLTAAYHRTGGNRMGQNLIAEALRQQISQPVRQHLYELVMARDASEWITQLLGEASPETRIAGLNVLAHSIKDEPERRAFVDTKLINGLRRASTEDVSADVRSLASDMLTVIRRRDIEQALSQYERTLLLDETRLHQMSSVNLAQVEANQKAELDRLNRSNDEVSRSVVERLRRKHGVCPEEADIRVKLAALRKEQAQQIALNLQLLEKLKKEVTAK